MYCAFSHRGQSWRFFQHRCLSLHQFTCIFHLSTCLRSLFVPSPLDPWENKSISDICFITTVSCRQYLKFEFGCEIRNVKNLFSTQITKNSCNANHSVYEFWILRSICKFIPLKSICFIKERWRWLWRWEGILNSFRALTWILALNFSIKRTIVMFRLVRLFFLLSYFASRYCRDDTTEILVSKLNTFFVSLFLDFFAP